MNNFLKRISVRFRLFVPLLAGIILAVALATIYLTRLSVKTLEYEMEQSLSLEVNIITKMFERDHELFYPKNGAIHGIAFTGEVFFCNFINMSVKPALFRTGYKDINKKLICIR